MSGMSTRNPCLPTSHVLYLHGFRSSPQSIKVRQIAAVLRDKHPHIVWSCPQLPLSPVAAMQTISAHIADWPKSQMAVIGSSLGGFYADLVARQFGTRAVLLNPVVHAARDLSRYLEDDAHKSATDLTPALTPSERQQLGPHDIEALQQRQGPPPTDPARYLVIIAQGDEVLDWREMQARYAACQALIIPGSDHALSNFSDHLPRVMEHLQLAPNPQPHAASVTRAA